MPTTRGPRHHDGPWRGVTELLRDADAAMYRAKDDGRARFQVFDAEMYVNALAQLHLEPELRRALGREELRLYYQPIIALAGDRVDG